MRTKDCLKIENLFASTADGKEILKGINLSIKIGEIHAVMGPNGSGKSTLAQVLMGFPSYVVTKGNITINNKSLIKMPPNLRAKEGLFLAFQYPVEVPGVNYAGFLRMALNEKSQNKARISPIAFRRVFSEKIKKLAFSDDVSLRSLNEGFSGGEKKKSEILQLSILKPKFAILDEPDSGLDVDALRYISKAVLSLGKSTGILLITHHQGILKYIKPDKVHIMIGGEIIKIGSLKLVKEIERNGYEKYTKK